MMKTELNLLSQTSVERLLQNKINMEHFACD